MVLTRAAVLALALISVGCGRGTGAPRATASEPVTKPVSSGTSPFEGGTLTLDVQGKPTVINLDFAEIANTDEGYPDFVELGGSGTYLAARVEPKMPSGEGDAYYKPVVGREFPMDVPVEYLDDPREITIPGQGKYPVTGGSITMEKYRLGDGSHDFWEGRISVTIQTAQGPVTLPGTFSVTIVPTW